MCRKSRLVAYLPNLKSVVRHFRAFSSYDESKPLGNLTEVVITGKLDLVTMTAVETEFFECYHSDEVLVKSLLFSRGFRLQNEHKKD